MPALSRKTQPYVNIRFTYKYAGGFSLIEVLVVITIIGLLASLLIPVIGMVRGSARALTCRANQRQVAMAVNLYAGEHRGYIASACLASGIHWFELLAPYVTSGKDSGGYVSMYDTSYDRRNIIVGCPDYKQTMNWRSGFGINERPLSPEDRRTTNWTSPTTNPKADFRLARVTNAAQRILLGDVDAWSIGVDPNSASWNFGRDNTRHRKVPNWMFFDLHAAGVSNTLVPKLIFDPANADY